MLIDGDIFLNDLLNKIKEFNIPIHLHEITTENITKLNENILFNCLGYKSKEIFNDNSF